MIWACISQSKLGFNFYQAQNRHNYVHQQLMLRINNNVITRYITLRTKAIKYKCITKELSYRDN
jgi:hypothetical protein